MEDFEILREPAAHPSAEEKILLSVVVPTSNTQDYLGACLNCLTVQGDMKIEVIVVDYKSIDRTLAMVEEFAAEHPEIPVTIVRQLKSGLGDARNFGAGIAKGEYIAFLDSDDFYVPHAYCDMVQYAITHGCDVVFSRGVVFDDQTAKTHYFYDDWVWDEILGGRGSLVTTATREPRLFRLEPSAGIRIMRRQFMLDRNIFYPEKKRAEDLVPHYQSLFEAERIGVVSKRGFFYRVGRAGKLTNDPSKWISDLLEATSRAIGESMHYEPGDEVGAAMIYLCVRSLFGYGAQLPYIQRFAYYRSASMLFAQMPRSWIRYALSKPMHPDWQHNIRMKIALLAFSAQESEFLVFWSSTPRSGFSILSNLLAHPSFALVLAHRYWRTALSKRPLRLMRRAQNA